MQQQSKPNRPLSISITQLSKYLSEDGYQPSGKLPPDQRVNEIKFREQDPALPWKGEQLPWNGSSCLAVACYVLNRSSNSRNRDVLHTLKRLDDLASEYEAISENSRTSLPRVSFDSDQNYTSMMFDDLASEYESSQTQELDETSPQREEKVREISRTFANCFIPEAQEFFSVPKRNEHLAGFLNFLLQILNSEMDPMNPDPEYLQETECGSNLAILPKESLRFLQESLMPLQAGLTFLLAVLGDAPFQFTMVEEANLLTRFKAVANEAGEFIYSCIFVTHAVAEQHFCKCICVLLDRLGVLNEMIKEHCIEFSELLTPTYADPEDSDPADSLFIANTLFKDLDDLVTCRAGLSDGMKDKIRTLHDSKLLTPTCAHPEYSDPADSLFIANSLLKDLEDLVTCRDRLSDGMKDQIRTLHEDLTLFRSFLKDVHMQQEIDASELKKCLSQFRGIAYEAEYLINSFVVGNFPNWYLSIRIPNVIQKLKFTGKKLGKARAVHDNKILNINEEYTLQQEQPQSLISSPITDDDYTLVGFQKEMLEILDELAGGSKDLRIISIYGMPGLGKTTFAKKLYTAPLIISHFDEQVWCTFSQTYKKRKVLIEILMSLRSLRANDEILDMQDSKLKESIYHSLKGRRFLIVMDDVWESAAWEGFGRYFPNDRNGSRILVTTRIKDIVPKNSIHTLPFLSEDQCWELLEKRVFLEEPCPPELQGSGKKIASKCNGLPLAVVVIAGALVNMETEKCAWERVGESLATYTSDCMKILELSYEHLPNHLKLCFLYLGVFPEDAEIPVKKLIWLWIAEGFIEKNKDKSPQDVAEEYLQNLIARSLVLVSRNKSTGGVKTCRIHDLVQEMCLKRAEKENFLYLIKDNHNSSNEKHHRLCALSTTPTHVRPFSLYCRSFFGHLSDPSSCLPQMKHLRVMKLSPKWGVSVSPKLNRIDLLVYLRYLVVDRMPELILGDLVNLEVLCVESMLHVVYVPSIVLKMAKLRHLHVKLQAKFHKDCDSSERNNLQSLSFISIDSTKSYEILTCSPHLRKLKCTCPPQIPDLSLLTDLKSLKIEISEIFQIPRNLTAINFPSTIKKLSLSGTFLPWERMSTLGKLPTLQALKLLWSAFEGKKWKTGEEEFQELRFLKLDGLNLQKWTAMSEHFPRLQHLVLHTCNKLKKIPAELGDFPNLQTIKVHNCSYKLSLSVVQIEQEQHDNGNEELTVIITDRRWSKEQLLSKYREVS